MRPSKNKAVILDRDGVINVNKGYVHKLEDFEFLPKAIAALKRLPKDFKLIIITNQSGIGRGFYTEKQFLSFSKVVEDLLLQQGIRIDKTYYCPHPPEINCECRKPKPALLKKAIKDFNLDVKSCFVIGDKTADIKMGETCGCHTILVKTGYGGKDKEYAVNPNYIAEDLYDAVTYILKNG